MGEFKVFDSDTIAPSIRPYFPAGIYTSSAEDETNAHHIFGCQILFAATVARQGRLLQCSSIVVFTEHVAFVFSRQVSRQVAMPLKVL